MRVEIRITENCNYDCHYCSSLHNNSKRNIKFDFLGFKNLVDQLHNPTIFVYGGEPTNHPDFKEIINWMIEYENISEIIIQTNCSRPKILNFNNQKVLINASYHRGIVKLKKFIKQIKTLNINEVSFMDSDDNYSEYTILKKIFGEKVQFCPIINPDINEKSSNKRLIELENKDIFSSLKKDYHFINQGIENKSNYDYWKDDSNYSKGNLCNIKKNTIHVQDNRVFDCFNDIFNDQIPGVDLGDYKYEFTTITCISERCYFDMHNWVEKC